jgi:hypothetical protein
MATETPALTYDRLNDDEIRLISFADNYDQAEGAISCRLERVRLSQNPVFFALSYAWGDGDTRKPLLVNGHPFRATQNLHNALSQIRQHAPTLQKIVRRESASESWTFQLWVDALCINQEDVDERSSQVPRMKDVYARAYNVLAWLGTTEEASLRADGYSLFLHEAFRLKRTDPLLEPTGPKLSEYLNEWGEDRAYIELFMVPFQVTSLPWFDRVWVIQEYALARRPPWALLGSGVFTLEVIRGITALSLPQLPGEHSPEVSDKMSSMMKSMTAVLNLFNGRKPARQFLDLPKTIQLEDFRNKALGDQLLYLLVVKGTNGCAIAHDHIYGILSLPDVKLLPEQLKPDYSQSSGLVYFEYMKYIVQQTGNLALMDCVNESHLDGLPSWVPDFRHLGAELASADPPTRNNVSWTMEGRVLAVEGAYVGRVLHYNRHSDDEYGDMVHLNHNLLKRSATIRGKTLQAVWREFLEPIVEVTHFPITYESMDEFLAIWSRLEHTEEAGAGKPASRLAEEMPPKTVAHVLRNSVYAVLDSGHIVRCWPKTLSLGVEEHLIWALKGTTKYTILSFSSEGYRYVGSCRPWVTVSEPLAPNLDESFFHGRKVERIALI